jgi:hypothetical protein
LFSTWRSAPRAIALAGPTPPGRDFRTELAAGLGFLALAVMCLQFVLTARFRRIKAPFGSDLVYAFHRDITVAVLVFMAAHPALLWFTPQREKVLVRALPRAVVVTATETYLHAEFRSAVFRFVDDAEFYADESAGVFQVRSAARVGSSDLGVNRKRVEEIRARWGEPLSR